MSATIPSRAPAGYAIALTLVTVLALLVAPVCAALCAAKNCSAGMSQAQCHEMAPAKTSASTHLAAPSETCQGADLSAVLFKADEMCVRLQKAPIGSTPEILGAAMERGFANLQASLWRGRMYRIPPASTDSPLITAILRI
jgi:hypothetical protein